MTASTFTLATLATALGALALASPVQAGEPTPVFGAFAAVCGGSGANFAAVRAAADAHGWGPTDVQPDPSMASVTVADQMSRASTVDKKSLVLSAWGGQTKTGVKVSDCAVHAAATDFAALRDDATSWLTFAPAESTDRKAVFRFTAEGAVLRALTPAEFDAAAGGAGLEILTVSGDANGTVLDLMMIKK